MTQPTTLAERILDYHFSLRPNWLLPEDVELLYPYDDPATRNAMAAFYHRYYADNRPRILIFGINPGRFGAGVTGVPFTDPIRLETECGIRNPFPKKQELSSDFVYRVVNAYGGPGAFFGDIYITSLSPLGFVRHGKNYNYYDDRELERAVEPYIIDNVRAQLTLGGHRHLALCLGEGQNYRYFRRLNDKHGFFERIVPLAHPRFVMQYRRKRVEDYVSEYVRAIEGGVRREE